MRGTIWLRLCKVKCVREKALLLELADGEEVWIPTSQIEDYSGTPTKGAEIDIEITEWIAEQKGLDS